MRSKDGENVRYTQHTKATGVHKGEVNGAPHEVHNGTNSDSGEKSGRIQHKREKSDKGADKRYRDNKDNTGNRPKGPRNPASTNTPKQKAMYNRVQAIANKDYSKTDNTQATATSKGSENSNSSPTSQTSQKTTHTPTSTDNKQTNTTQANKQPVNKTETTDQQTRSQKNQDKQSPNKNAIGNNVGKDKKDSKSGLVSKGYNKAKSSIAKGYQKAKDATYNRGKETGEGLARGADTVYSRLNKPDHIK